MNFIYLNQKGSLPKTNPSVWLTKNKLPNIRMESIASTFLKYFLLYMLHDLPLTLGPGMKKIEWDHLKQVTEHFVHSYGDTWLIPAWLAEFRRALACQVGGSRSDPGDGGNRAYFNISPRLWFSLQFEPASGLGGKVKQLALSPSSFFHWPNGRDFCKRKGRVVQTNRGSSPNGVVYLAHIIHIMGWVG